MISEVGGAICFDASQQSLNAIKFYLRVFFDIRPKRYALKKIILNFLVHLNVCGHF